MTVVRTEEMSKQGFTTVEQVVNSLASNQSATVGASSVQTVSGGASYASLRGLGSQYTLVLLDGRRVASQAIGGYATDLNAIPLSAIERIEVLRDGASAIYGTDAIGGVINFITKKSYQGVTVSGELLSTEHKGGNTGSASITAGIGDLAKDGYNVYGSLSYQKLDPITTLNRSFANKYLSADNLSGRVFPSNFTYKGNAYNPAAQLQTAVRLAAGRQFLRRERDALHGSDAGGGATDRLRQGHQATGRAHAVAAIHGGAQRQHHAHLAGAADQDRHLEGRRQVLSTHLPDGTPPTAARW